MFTLYTDTELRRKHHPEWTVYHNSAQALLELEELGWVGRVQGHVEGTN